MRPADGWPGGEGRIAALCAVRSRTDRRDRPCDPVTRRRVMVYCHPVVEQPDEEQAEFDDHQRTAGRDASQTTELLRRWEQHSYGGERPDVVQQLARQGAQNPYPGPRDGPDLLNTGQAHREGPLASRGFFGLCGHRAGARVPRPIQSEEHPVTWGRPGYIGEAKSPPKYGNVPGNASTTSRVVPLVVGGRAGSTDRPSARYRRAARRRTGPEFPVCYAASVLHRDGPRGTIWAPSASGEAGEALTSKLFNVPAPTRTGNVQVRSLRVSRQPSAAHGTGSDSASDWMALRESVGIS
jgi:hypothetical protein